MTVAPGTRLILASGSRGRRELMERAGYPFAVRVSNVPEPTEAVGGNVARYVAELAWLKAQAVAAALDAGPHLVIAADTVGWHAGRVVGKPEGRDDARRIIAGLAGTTHDLYSGVSLWYQTDGLNATWQFTWQELSRVAMAPLSPDAIERYLDTRLWEGCSGAYALQMPSDPILTVVEGTASNVIGLPMESLAAALARVGWAP